MSVCKNCTSPSSVPFDDEDNSDIGCSGGDGDGADAGGNDDGCSFCGDCCGWGLSGEGALGG